LYPTSASLAPKKSLNNLFWNLNSFDAAASFASETADMKTMYPRGIFIGLLMCILFYLAPLMIAVGATDYEQSEWIDGHMGRVAMDIGGTWLGGWTIFAAGISNLALFEAGKLTCLQSERVHVYFTAPFICFRIKC
jgi:amino acid transporter